MTWSRVLVDTPPAYGGNEYLGTTRSSLGVGFCRSTGTSPTSTVASRTEMYLVYRLMRREF